MKGWFGTWSRVDGKKEDLLQHLRTIDEVEEYCICSEKHEDGGSHFHAYVKFLNGMKPKDVLRLKWNGRTAKAEAARSVRAVLKYVKKDGDFISSIENVQTFDESKSRKRNRTIMEMGAEEALKEGYIHPRDYKAVKTGMQMYRLATTLQVPTDTCKGVWIHGASGCGKTTKALSDYPGCFRKSANKWWDGYDGQKVVLLDDLKLGTGKALSWHLCMWMDRHCPPGGEVKGGTVVLPFALFVVTSQYSIQEMFPDQEDYEAIYRRCKGRISNLTPLKPCPPSCSFSYPSNKHSH